MQLILLGTGCPKVDHKRFGPSNLVFTKNTTILVDCGSGVSQRLQEAKVSTADIDDLNLRMEALEKNAPCCGDLVFTRQMDF